MNKITVFQDEIESILDDKIHLEMKMPESIYDVMELHIKVIEATTLELHDACKEDRKINIFSYFRA